MGRVKDSLIRKQEEDQEFAASEYDFQQNNSQNNTLTEKKMKKVAFDVQGTLLGGGQKVLNLYKWFQGVKRCDMSIWSFGGALMAADAAAKCKLNAHCQSKTEKLFGDEGAEPEMDICVDDDSFTALGLSAKHVILVKDIPEDPLEFEKTFGHLLK